MNSSNATTSTPTVMILSTCKHIEVEHSIMKIGGRLLQSVCQSRWRTLLCSELMEQKRRGYTFTCRDYLLMWPGKQEVRCDRLEQCLLPFLQIACCTEISSVMHISKGLIGWSCIATHFQLCTQTIFAVPKAVLSKASDSYMIKGSVFKKKKMMRKNTNDTGRGKLHCKCYACSLLIIYEKCAAYQGLNMIKLLTASNNLHLFLLKQQKKKTVWIAQPTQLYKWRFLKDLELELFVGRKLL